MLVRLDSNPSTTHVTLGKSGTLSVLWFLYGKVWVTIVPTLEVSCENLNEVFHAKRLK